jgi:peptide deformylase
MSNEKDPNTLEVSVADTVGVSELGPGGPVAPEKTEEQIQAEREEAIRKVLERKVELADKYVAPHKKPARRVKAEDLPRVLNEAAIMHEMCMVGRGEYNTAFAIAHTQIDDQDPLRFFVTIKGEIYINPFIIDKNHELVQTKEGCMSYPDEPMKTVTRFKKVTAKYRTVAHKVDPNSGESLGEHYLTKEIVTDFDGQMAQIVQHECQHLNGWDIYREGTGALKAIGEPVVHEADKNITT